jgi:DeoR/GlpR family transcriptional regulator of sugar metabolism
MEATARLDAEGRLAALAELLQREGRVEVAQAASTLGAAEMTIRRDLDRMAAMGLARRVRGGAISLLMRGEEPPFALRAAERADAKRRIGTVVAALLRDGEAVILDSGSTAVETGRALAGRRLTVMPMSLHAAAVLSAGAAPRLLMPGGEARPGELSLTGPLAVASIGALRFDTAVLSCCGLADGLVTAHDLGDADVKQAMLRSSARVVLVADSSKFGRSALAVVCPADAVDIVVTDTSAPGDAVEVLREAGVEVRCV